MADLPHDLHRVRDDRVELLEEAERLRVLAQPLVDHAPLPYRTGIIGLHARDNLHRLLISKQRSRD